MYVKLSPTCDKQTLQKLLQSEKKEFYTQRFVAIYA